MCDIIDFTENQPQILVQVEDQLLVFPLAMVRKIASGQESIAEYRDIELIARAWAIALIERL